MNKSLKIGIVGAGIQGVSNALFLQKKGFEVTIFDKDEPGSPAASYGNAGHFSPYASLSLNRTDVLADVPAMLLSSTGPLALKWNYVPKMIPWFIKFILNNRLYLFVLSKEINQVLTFYFIMFILFRIFDIVKPYPVSYYDKNFKNSFGVIMDDVVAGLYVVAVLVLYMVLSA